MQVSNLLLNFFIEVTLISHDTQCCLQISAPSTSLAQNIKVGVVVGMIHSGRSDLERPIDIVLILSVPITLQAWAFQCPVRCSVTSADPRQRVLICYGKS